MVRIADETVCEKLSEVADRVARGEHVTVQLADGRSFTAVPSEDVGNEENAVGRTWAQDTEIGRRLLQAREEALRHGEDTLTWEGIEEELAERRGERSDASHLR